MDLGLAGKVAMVVGAGADVGRAVALVLAKEAAEIILVGRTPEALEETGTQVRAAGGQAHIIPADLGDQKSVEGLVKEAVATCSRLDLLANTAGPFPTMALAPNAPAPPYGSDESWVQAFDGVFMTAARLMREAMPVMKAQGHGSIVHMCSNSARHYSSMTAQFGAMKAALVHAVKNWARDGAQNGIRVNAVLPGWIKGWKVEQRLHDIATRSGASLEQAEREMVMGRDGVYWTPRMGRPQDYANAIVFLLSDRASYINGALLPVDGGSPVW